MAITVSKAVRQAVLNLLDQPFSARLGSVGGSTARAALLISPDVEQFRVQSVQLERLGLSQKAAVFRDQDDPNTLLPVLLAPELLNLRESFDELSGMLTRSGIRLEDKTQDEAKEIFVDRASEFVQSRVKRKSGGPPAPPGGAATIVHSNRSGDTVLYCRGYFVSTATAFGVSTPCRNSIPAGRYSFGIVEDHGAHRFVDVIWTCPTTVKLNLP